MAHARQRRCETQRWLVDETKARDVLSFADGELGSPHVRVEGSRLMLQFKSAHSDGVYTDDAIAVLRDVLAAFLERAPDVAGTHTRDAIVHLNAAIKALDQRALARHGYAGSSTEQAYAPPYVAKNAAKNNN